jgi:hypothetical protein
MQSPGAGYGQRKPVAPLDGLWFDVVIGAIGCGIVGPVFAWFVSAIFLRLKGEGVDIFGMTFAMPLYFVVGDTGYALAVGALLSICSRYLLQSGWRSYAVTVVVGAALGSAAPAVVPDLAHELRLTSLLLAAIPCAMSGSLCAFTLNQYIRRKRQELMRVEIVNN